jgi:UDP-N-acetylglucosamine 2-epimerase (non-hydrolysing)
LVASLADLHFAPTHAAADALRAETVAGAVHVTGNTGIDALCWTAGRLIERPELAAGLDAVAARVAGRRLILVTAHRRENHGEAMASIARAVRRIAARPDVAVLLPLHPNPAAGDAMAAMLADATNVLPVPPLDYPHFVRALGLCHLVLTDSGGVQEEAPSLGKPVLVLRRTTERPEGVAAGTARLVGADEDRIVEETVRLLDDPQAHAAMARAYNPYGDGRAARRIAAILRHTHGIAGQGRCDPGERAYIEALP